MDHTDKLIEHQGSRAAEGVPEGTPPVEEVLMGDEDDDIDIIGVRQEARGIPADNVGEEEASKEDAGEARPPGEEEDAQDNRRSTTNHMDEEKVAEQTPTGADISMAVKFQILDQTSNVRNEEAAPLPKRALA